MEAPRHLHRTLQLIRDQGLSTGVALNPATPAEAVDCVLEMVDLVLVMSVNPGFGGQAYLPLATRKIETLAGRVAARGLKVALQVDGGINENTIGEAAAAGATHFVAGTAVFGAEDYEKAISTLRALAEQARKGLP